MFERQAAGSALVYRATLVGHGNAVDLVYSRDGRRLASCSIDLGRVWEMPSGRVAASFPEGDGSMARCPSAFSQEATTVVLVERRVEHSSIRLWDVSARKAIRTFDRAPSYISVAGFSHDGTALVTGGRQARLWDVASGRATATFPGPDVGVGAATLHPDGTVLAGVGNDRVVRLWDVASRRQLTTWTPPTSDNISDLTFSPDGGILAVGGGEDRASAVWLFDVTSGRLAATLAPSNHWGCSIAFSPDGRYLVTVSYDTADSGITQVWDLRLRRPVATVTGVSTAAFSPDGKTLATGDRAGTIRLWTVRRPPA